MAGDRLEWAVLLLSAPAVAMRVTDEVRWDAADFVFAAMLIGGVGLAAELAVRWSSNWAYRGGVALALLATFALLWINAAVGIIGNEGNPLNLLYGGVIAVAVGGGMVAHFQATGMCRAMLASAGCQAAMLLVAEIAGATSRRERSGWRLSTADSWRFGYRRRGCSGERRGGNDRKWW